MSDKILGRFTVWGTPGTVEWSGFATTDNALKSASITDNLSVADARDGEGYIFGSRVRRDTQTLTVKLIPHSGATLAAAKALLAYPGPGAVVTLAGFGDSLVDGTWNYIGGAQVSYPENPEETWSIDGVQLRRVANAAGTIAAQTVSS